MSAPQAWEGVADEVCATIAVAIGPTVRKAADDLYEHLMVSVQDYLADNVAFNIASTLAVAERGRRFEWERAEKSEATARDLLEALSAMVAVYAMNNAEPVELRDALRHQVAGASAAIAKAEFGQ